MKAIKYHTCVPAHKTHMLVRDFVGDNTRIIIEVAGRTGGMDIALSPSQIVALRDQLTDKINSSSLLFVEGKIEVFS